MNYIPENNFPYLSDKLTLYDECVTSLSYDILYDNFRLGVVIFHKIYSDHNHDHEIYFFIYLHNLTGFTNAVFQDGPVFNQFVLQMIDKVSKAIFFATCYKTTI